MLLQGTAQRWGPGGVGFVLVVGYLYLLVLINYYYDCCWFYLGARQRDPSKPLAAMRPAE
jgi:hypothetical protein